MYIHCVRAHALFVSLQLGWAITTGRLLGPATCLPYEDGGIPLSALPKDTTSKLAGLFSTLLFCAERNTVTTTHSVDLRFISVLPKDFKKWYS